MSARLAQVVRESGLRRTLLRLAGRQTGLVASWLDRQARRLTSPADLRRTANAATLNLLAANAELRGHHAGQRCFVLASGPSSQLLDLSPLRGEVVLAVNEMFLALEKWQINAAYLMILDAAYLRPNAGARSFLADMNGAARQMGADAVIPASALKECQSSGLFTDCVVRPVMQVGRLLDYPSAASTPQLDFTAPVPGMYTVSHMAIAFALFLGFNDIYVLGVDLDYIAAPEVPIRHSYGANPYNEHDKIPASTAFEQEAGWSYSDLLRQVAAQQDAFARLAEIGALNGQRVWNAAPGGCLYTLPRVDFPSIFR